MDTNRKELELYSDKIELVLSQHKLAGRVTGGVVTPRAIQFHIAGATAHALQQLAGDLARALGADDVRVVRVGIATQLEIKRSDAATVKLLPLLARLTGPKLPDFTAALGLCDDGAPLLLRLPSPDVGHILVAGEAGRSLLRTIALSLVITERPQRLRFVFVGRTFDDLATLPHVHAEFRQHGIGDLAGALRSLGDLAQRRRDNVLPRVVIVIDDLARVAGDDTTGSLLRGLLKGGHAAGIHVIAYAQDAAKLGAWAGDFATRLVGQVKSPEAATLQARSAAGLLGTGAEKLEPGDFIAIAGGQVIRFTAAAISSAELRQVVAQMGSRPARWDLAGRPSLLRAAVARLT